MAATAATTQCVGAKVNLVPGEERARMGTRPRPGPGPGPNQNQAQNQPQARIQVTHTRPEPGQNQSVSDITPLAPPTGPVEGVANGGAVFCGEATSGRTLRQTSALQRPTDESAYRYRHLVVRKQDGFTHIILSTRNSQNNTLTPR
ncbi:hypothetical protein WMY93_031635 [Mugilogobius chulae]|uniref:Uncharacterized protein n=1 Tax=Mugilogobius chulae TaxID=88201 RepID=A0AAW0MM98_9GOBI